MNVPQRRWFRFSLRTLFVVVTLLGCWLGYQLNWIRQRHAFLARQRNQFAAVNESEHYDVDDAFLKSVYNATSTDAPWPLGILSEPGRVELRIMIVDDGPGKEFDAYGDCRTGRRLFPESSITWYLLEKGRARRSD